MCYFKGLVICLKPSMYENVIWTIIILTGAWHPPPKPSSEFNDARFGSVRVLIIFPASEF